VSEAYHFAAAMIAAMPLVIYKSWYGCADAAGLMGLAGYWTDEIAPCRCAAAAAAATCSSGGFWGGGQGVCGPPKDCEV